MKKMVIYVFIICLFVLFQNDLILHATEDNNYDIPADESIQLSFVDSALNNSLPEDYVFWTSNYDSFLDLYFDNLTSNFGMNYKGSCGYVAMAMMLSYYDTYLSDEIIPEQYDVISTGYNNDIVSRRKSPGVFRDYINDDSISGNFFSGYYMSAGDYFLKIKEYSNFSLHAKLISIAESLGYYNYLSIRFPAASNFSKRLDVLEKYFETVLEYDEDDYSINSINKELFPWQSYLVRQFVIEQINLGNPVILSIGAEPASLGRHVVIAYDYNTDEDKIYCHFGWGANETHVTIEERGYSYYLSALTVNFTQQHSHSNNYGVTTIEQGISSTNYYCCNDCNILTYNHPHFYSGHYCMYCNHVNNNHTFGEPYIWIDYSVHSAVCDCGLITNQGHAVIGSSPSLGGYKTCIRCGGLAQIGFDFNNPLTTGYRYISNNGSYISTNGVVVLAEIDINSYLLGTLEFHKEIFNVQHI